MYEKSKTNIKFTYNHEGYSANFYSYPETKIDYTIDGESTITEACQAFENFLLACGFRLNDGETIGVIQSESESCCGYDCEDRELLSEDKPSSWSR